MKNKKEKFKVMEWLNQIRNQDYQLYKKDPDEYYRIMEEKGDELERWLIAADRLSRHDWSHLK